VGAGSDDGMFAYGETGFLGSVPEVLAALASFRASA